MYQNKARINADFKDAREDIVRYLLDQRQRIEAAKFAEVLRGASETKVLITNATPPQSEAERARVLATVLRRDDHVWECGRFTSTHRV